MAICIARLLSSNLKGVVEQKFSRSPVQSALFTAPPPPQYHFRSDGPGQRPSTTIWIPGFTIDNNLFDSAFDLCFVYSASCFLTIPVIFFLTQF